MRERQLTIALFAALFGFTMLSGCAEDAPAAAYADYEEPIIEEPIIEEPIIEEPEEPIDEEPPPDLHPIDEEPPPRRPRPPLGAVDCYDGWDLTYWHSPILRTNNQWITMPLRRCAADGIIGVIPRNTTWDITVQNLVPGDTVKGYSPHYFTDEVTGNLRNPVARTGNIPASGTASFRYTAWHGGEHVFVVETDDPEAERDVYISARCVHNCHLVTTRFPVMMVSGLLGFDALLGGLVSYWNGIPGPMESLGLEVYTPAAHLINNNEANADVISDRMDDILAETGARKVNIIAHSQGGLVARVLASPGGLQRGHQVASITTIGTPHHGLPVPLLEELTGAINAIVDAIPNFGESSARAFNRKYVDDSRVDYHSWRTQTCDSLKELYALIGLPFLPDLLKGIHCRVIAEGEIVNSILEWPYRIMVGSKVIGLEIVNNDGLVPLDSAIWGPPQNQHGPLWADHLDQIGHLFRSADDGAFNHVTFYQDWARRLIQYGH